LKTGHNLLVVVPVGCIEQVRPGIEPG